MLTFYAYKRQKLSQSKNQTDNSVYFTQKENIKPSGKYLQQKCLRVNMSNL